MKTLIKVLVLTILIVTAGCGMQDSLKKPLPDQKISQEEKQIQINQDLAEKAKDTARMVKGVQDSTAVVINKEISVAVKVGGFDRLRLKQVKNEVHEKIKAFNKDHNIHVTSDKKLFNQLQQVENQLKGAQEQSLLEIQKKVIVINKAM